MLSLRDLSYTFAGNQVRAVDCLNLDFPAGKIHAVIGENGAGKSTLARICTGHISRPEGKLILNEKDLVMNGPVDGIAQGLALVPQHPHLAQELQVWQNLLLGAPCAEENQSAWFSKKASLESLSRRLADWKIQLPLETAAHKLDASHTHWVVIAEALLAQPAYLFLDEPSAPYGPDDVAALYALLHLCADSGMSVVVITHRLQEVLDHADHIHILRHGQLATSLPARKGMTRTELLEPMFGEKEEDAATKPAPPLTYHSSQKVENLCIKNLHIHQGPGRSLYGLNIVAPTGLVTGIIGMKDQGLEVLEDLLSGMLKSKPGHLLFEGRELTKLPQTQRGYIPGRRFQRGIAPGRNIGENAISRARGTLFPHAWISTNRHQAWFAAGDAQLFEEPTKPVVSLSGGMIQRLIFQRELDNPPPRLIIAAEPYWGLDRHFQSILRDRLFALARSGAVVLFLSSELDDAIESCDSIAVLNAGHIVHTSLGPDYDRSVLAMHLVHQEQLPVMHL